MRSFFDKVARVFGWLDAAEFVIPAVIAVLLLVFGPLLACLWFLRAKHYSPALVSGCLWLLMAFCLVRDFRRRRFSLVSLTLGVLWLVATGIILWQLEGG